MAYFDSLHIKTPHPTLFYNPNFLGLGAACRTANTVTENKQSVFLGICGTGKHSTLCDFSEFGCGEDEHDDGFLLAGGFIFCGSSGSQMAR